MSTAAWSQAGSASSGELPIADVERLTDVEWKQRRVAEFLNERGYDALLLQRPAHFAWFTCGGDSTRGGSSETTAALFLTPQARVVAAGNIDAAQLFERDLGGLGFQLKERPWHEPRPMLLEDLCRGRRVAGDGPSPGAWSGAPLEDVSADLVGLRVPLTVLECERMRKVGRIVAHAVEATARGLTQGDTEVEIAGELAHRLIKHGAWPERLQVFADPRTNRHPHWTFGEKPVDACCTIAAVARKWGLCAAAARTVSFGRPDDGLRDAYLRATLVQATGMHFCQPGWELAEVWNRAQRIYEKFGRPDEWQHADQAEVVGYGPCEAPVVPRSEFRLTSRMAVHWHPSVGPAVVGDTILVGRDGFETLTPFDGWPKLTVEIRETSLVRPAILRR